MKYIDYKNTKKFYTIDETCRLFEMEKEGLRRQSEKYHVYPEEDQFGNWGFPKRTFCRLHNKIYKENQEGKNSWDKPPFNDSQRGPWE